MLFKDLKQNLNKDFTGLPVVRLALLGDSATQFLAKALRGYGYAVGVSLEIFEADFDQLDQQILDGQSELYHSHPHFVVVYLATERLWSRFAAVSPAERAGFADSILGQIKKWWEAIGTHSSASIIQLNFVEVNDAVFGHFAGKTAVSFPYQLRRLNYELMNRARENSRVFIADVAGLASLVGYVNAHDPRLYATSKVAFALDFLPAVAKAILDIVRACQGKLRKCLVLDLDNTVWGGVIGDDGLENIQVGELGIGHAYDALQRWARQLKQRGIILAVCSKNEDANARRPFLEHPDMILRLEDIAVFVANWNNKADNLKQIQATLNIGLDSMVFLDDSAFERNLVRQLLPEVTVPELPEDPALVVPYLCSLNLFETATFSEEDLQRTRQYQEEAQRRDFQNSFASLDEYLASLAMVSSARPFDGFSLPRVAQLVQRSNQFNLRTVRHSEAELGRLAQAADHLTIAFQLHDKFGDHGIIGLIILNLPGDATAFIDTWIMSCRVLKRGVEEFMVNEMARRAHQRGVSRLVGEYLPTTKNALVKNLYPQLGFAANDGRWLLDLDQFKMLKTFVQLE